MAAAGLNLPARGAELAQNQLGISIFFVMMMRNFISRMIKINLEREKHL
jgi:hypothetical protein